MLSLQMGTTPLRREVLSQADNHPLLTGVDKRVGVLGKNLGFSVSHSKQSAIRNHAFSPLRFLWWASLLLGARAQQTTPFPSTLDLLSLSGSDGFSLSSGLAGEESGFSVASAGDVNADGIDDLILGAYSATPAGKLYAGKSYVIFGSAGLNTINKFNFQTLAPNGFVINGELGSDFSGCCVASAGDVNGDGIGDLVIGAYGANAGGQFSAGKTYVVFGQMGLGSSGVLELSSLNGMNGFVLNGEHASDQSGKSIAGAGDLNADGIADLVIGAVGASPNGKTSAGKSYVVFGKVGLGSSGSLDLSSLNGTNGFVLNGEIIDDLSGYSVAGAGDVNGDQVGDLIIGAPGANPGARPSAGKSYVVFGRSGLGSSGSVELSSLDGMNGFVLNGESTMDQSGISVASVRNLNGDTLADLLIGAKSASPSSKDNAGKTYVVFGQMGIGSNGVLELSSLKSNNGFVINGGASKDQSGNSVASAGDINGDGISELVLGAPNASPSSRSQAGKTYVVFGRAGLNFMSAIDLSNLSSADGFTLIGESSNDNSGYSVASAGDVNNDGIADLLIGAPVASPGSLFHTGKCYVVFGRRFATAAPSPISTFPFTASKTSTPFQPFRPTSTTFPITPKTIGSTVSTTSQTVPAIPSSSSRHFQITTQPLLTTSSGNFLNGTLISNASTTGKVASSTFFSSTSHTISASSSSSTLMLSSTQTSMSSLTSETSTKGHSPDTAPLGTSSSKIPLYAGVAIAVCAVATALFVGIFVWCRKRKSAQAVPNQIELANQSGQYQSVRNSAVQEKPSYQALELVPPQVESQYALAPAAPIGKEGVHSTTSPQKSDYTAAPAKPRSQSIPLNPLQVERAYDSVPPAPVGIESIYSVPVAKNSGYDAPPSKVQKDYDQPGAALD